MRWSPTRVDDMAPMRADDFSETGRTVPQRAGTLMLIARAEAHDRISAALRDARRRAGLSEQEVVDLLGARGVVVSARAVERWERTGGIRLEEAVDLAAVYGMSLDDLAAPRGWHGRFLGSLERTRADGD